MVTRIPVLDHWGFRISRVIHADFIHTLSSVEMELIKINVFVFCKSALIFNGRPVRTAATSRIESPEANP